MSEVRIKLGGQSYSIPQFSISQIKRMGEFIVGDTVDALGFLQVATEQAKPPIYNFDEIKYDLDEITEALNALMRFSGLISKESSQANEAKNGDRRRITRGPVISGRGPLQRT